MSLNYREFYRQIELLSEYNKLSKADQVLHILLACDIDIYGQTNRNNKKYALIQYSNFYSFISKLKPEKRCYNELIKPNIVCKQFFDLDAPFNDHNKSKIEFVKDHFHTDFILFWDDLNIQNEYGCKVLINQNPELLSSHTMYTYSSSNEKKFSWHVVFPQIVMQNNYHCGAIMRRFEIFLLNKYGDNHQTNPYYILKNTGMTDFIIDRAIYTIHRVFRLLFNTKGGQKRPLKPNIISKYYIESKTINIIDMLCSDSLDKLMNLSFLQNFDDYTTTPYASCCEIRSFLVYENNANSFQGFTSSSSFLSDDSSNLSSTDKFEWIEPYSIGDRIFSMSVNRLKRLNMMQYNNLSSQNNPANHNIRMSRTLSFSQEDNSSSHDHLNSNISDELNNNKFKNLFDNLLHFKNIQLNQFLNQEKNKKNDQKITKAYVNVTSLSKKFIAERCHPEWIYDKNNLNFLDIVTERTVNIDNGTIFVYPKNIRRCQFKSYSDHTGNHIYFVIYCLPILHQVGFYQKCHSNHHFGSTYSKIHVPFRNQLEEKLFTDLQKKMKKYIAVINQAKYILIDLPQEFQIEEEKQISSYILTSLVYVLFNHFIKSSTEKLFSLFNQISNTEIIFQSISRLNNQFHHYFEMIKNHKFKKHFFIKLIDQIVVKSLFNIVDKKIRKFYLKLYADYRSNLIVFSLSNLFMNNNFNHLIEESFLTILKDNNVDLKLSEKTVISKKCNNNMLFIYRLASLTEKKIYDYYNYLKEKTQENKDDNEKEEGKNILFYINQVAINMSKFMENNYKIISII